MKTIVLKVFRTLCALVFLVVLAGAKPAMAATLVHEFFLPMPEAQIRQTFFALETNVNTTVNSTFSVVVTGDGTVVYYDHWEDGYEVDLRNKVQTTTLIWGDGNNANGIAPGFVNDPAGLTSGTVLTLNNNVPLPRNPATILYDGRDRVAATKALVISRMAYPTSPGSVLADAVEIPATIDYGTNFICPVGQDIGSTLFQYTALMVMAGQDNTTITISTNGTTVFANIVLNRGESYLVNGGIRKGAYVTATKPVQAQLVRGRVGVHYETDWFTLVPRSEWSSSYYTPVGTAPNGNPTYVFVYNPNATNITINVTNRTGSASFVVSNAVHRYLMPANSGASFTSVGAAPFSALSVVAAQASSQVYDWGFTLLPSDALTSVAVVGMGLGSSDGSQNGNPVWVTAPSATRIYVDMNGRGNGALTDPFGRKYDVHYDVIPFESIKIYDTSDKNQTAMRLFTADGTPITAAWGQDPAVAGTGNPYLDAGTTVLPFPVPVIRKTSILAIDNAPPGLSVGDVLEYTVELDNKGLLPLGNLVVIDAPPANITYLSNSTTIVLEGVTNAVADNVGGLTAFPLDETGYTIPVILRGGTSRFTYRSTIIGAGPINNTVTASGYNVSAQSSVNAPSGGITPPTVNFTDSVGSTVSSYSPGSGVYVTVADIYSNTSAATVQTFTVNVRNTTTDDVETITLTETGVNTGVFRNTTPLPSSLTAGLLQQDGTLNAVSGNSLSVLHVNLYGTSANASAVISVLSQNKVLYLATNNAANGQVLQRIDPANALTLRNNNGRTVVLDASVSTATVAHDISSSGVTTANTITIKHTNSLGNNRLMLVSVATEQTRTITSITYAGQTLTSIGSASDTGGQKPRIELFRLIAPPTGSNNLIVNLSAAGNTIVGATTFINVDQTTPLGAVITGANSLSVASGSANELVFAAITTDTPATLTPGAGQTTRWDSTQGSRSAGSTKTGVSPSVTMSWTISGGGTKTAAVGVAVKPATSAVGVTTATFGQSPTFALDFTMLSGSTVRITNYVSIVSGAMPASPNLTARLSHSGTTFLTLTNAAFTSINAVTGMVVWSSNLTANVTIPAGQVISYLFSNAQAGVTFRVDYDTALEPSKIILPTTNVIKITSLGIYDAPYPGGALVSSPVSGTTLYARAVVTDPFGASDIRNLNLNIDGPGTAGDIATTLTTAVASDTSSKTYEYTWVTGATIGSYTVSGVANEGTEGITDSASTFVTLNFLDNGTPSTAELTSGNNGTATTAYAANASVCIRVKDLDKNINATTIQTITAVVKAGSDSESVTLTETGVNTGIFTACVTSSTTLGAGSNSGTLLAPAGSVITLTYTDPDDTSDVSTATAAIPAASPSVSVTNTRLTASTATVGQTVQFQIVVANNGNSALPTVSLTETFPAALTYVSATSTPNTVGGTTLTWNNVGPLAVGQSTNITVTFTAAAAAAPAQTTAAANAGGGVTGSANASVTIVSPAALVITKTITSGPGSVNIGDNITFQITVQNTGGIAIATLPLEDTFSAACFEYVSSTPTPDGTGAGTIFWSDITGAGSLAGGSSIVINVTMKVVGGCSPADNTAKADFAEDANGGSVPSSSGSVSRTTVAATIAGGVYTTNAVGLANSTVELYSDPNNDGDPADGTVVRVLATDANGAYEIPNLAVGNYVLVQTDLPGYASLTPANNRIAVNVTNLVSAYANRDFIDYVFNPVSYATISGNVWNDANVNGVKDVAETGVTNVIVELVQDVNGNDVADNGEPVVSSTTSGAFGAFSFGNLIPGDYVIVKTDFFGYVPTADSFPPNDNEIGVTVTGGQTSSGHYFLAYYAGSGGGNNAPVALADSYTVLEDQALIVAAGGVLTNDVDIDANALTAALVSSTANGGLVFNPNGSFTYTPNAAFNGTDSFTYKANDGSLDSGVATVTITVTSVNDAPTLNAISNLSINEDAALQTVNLSGISSGAADEAQTLIVTASSSDTSIVPNPSVTYTSANATGSIAFTPVANAFGTVTITVTVQDNGSTANGGVTTTTRTFDVTVNPVNDIPSFVKGANQTVLEDAAVQSISAWATAISAGPANESTQTLTFNVSNDNNSLFSVQPAIASNGTLTYTPSANAFGVATVTVTLNDNGGTALGGVDTTAAQVFTITLTQVNDVPSFTKGADQTVSEDTGLHTVSGWATAISAGANETQTLTFNVSNDNNALFSVQPAIASNGTLTYTLAVDAFGSAALTVTLSDNGGVANSGADTSGVQTFNITVDPINDVPGFTKGADQSVNNDAGAQSLLNWATAISKGPANESSQTLTFLVGNDNNALFLTQPSIAANGTLTFTPSGTLGTATVTVQLQDNGGIANGGQDTSSSQTFVITVGAANLVAATGGQAISADTVGGAWTALTGPTYTEGADGNVGVGTIILNVPAGFEFDTTGTSPTVLVTRLSGTGANINGVSSGSSLALTAVSSTQLTLTITSSSLGDAVNSLTWQNVRVRPTAGNPLASGNITKTGTSSMTSITDGLTNFGTLGEVPGAAVGLAVSTQPSVTATAGVAFAQQPVVRVVDQFGNTVVNDSTTEITVVRNAGTGTLQGTTTVTVVNGIATFTNLNHTVAGTIDLTFTSPTLAPVTSTDIVISPAAAVGLAITTEPSVTATAGVAFGQQPAVRVVDAFGNTVTSDNTTQITAVRAAGAGTLQGTTTVTVVNGIATFTGLNHTVAGTIDLDFSSTPALGTVNSTDIVISPAAAASLAIATQPSGTATAGVSFAQQPVVRVVDAFGNLVTSDSTTQITVTRAAGAGTLQGTTTVTVVNGIATFAGLNHTVAGTIDLDFSSAPALGTVNSTDIVISPAAADHLVIATQPSATATAGVAFVQQPVVQVVDAFGNVVTSDSTTQITAVRAAGAGTLQGTTTVTVVNGIATFADLNHTVAGTIDLDFSSTPVLGTVNSTDILISPAAAVGLAIVTEPSASATAGVAFGQQPAVRVVDAFGNTVTSDNTTQITAVRAAGAGTLQGTTTVTVVNGIATFAGLNHTVAGTIDLDFTSTPALGTVNSTDIVVSPAAAASLVIATEPSATATAGVAFVQQPVVRVVDAFGNTVTSDSTTQITAVRAAGAGTLQGTTTVTVVNGIATFAGLNHTVAGTIDLDFSSTPALGTVNSTDIVISPAAAVGLAIATEPSASATAGVAFGQQPAVRVVDAFGNTVTSDNTTQITAVRAAGVGTLQGTTTVTVVNGIATFADLNHTVAGTIDLGFSSTPALGTVNSTDIVISPAAAASLVIATEPSATATAAVAFAQQPVVRVVDAFGNTVTSDSTTQITAVRAAGAGTLQGTTTVTVVNGIATFAGLNHTVAGTIDLDFSSTPALGTVNSTDIVISPAAAASLVIATQPSATATAGVAFAQQPVVRVVDAFGNTVTSDSTTQITAVRDEGTGTLQGTTTVTVVNGIATFADLNHTVAGTIDLTFSSTPALGTVTSTDIVISPAVAAQVVFVQQPSDTEVFDPITPAVSVQLQDAFGNNVSSAGVTITLALSSGTGTLSGTTAVDTDAAGLATFAGLSLDLTGDKELTASSGAFLPATSDTFTISASNTAPSFTKGPDQTELENSGLHTVANWATDINSGDVGQTVWFEVLNNDNSLFSVQPAISPTGELTYTLAPNMNGVAIVTVVMRDDGGTIGGGIDASAPQTFNITVLPVNSAPIFTLVTNNVVVLEDAGSLNFTLASVVNPGAPDEAAQILSTMVISDNPSLFTVQPSVDSNGNLTYTLAPNANGVANVTLTIVDDGGVANGGQNTTIRNFAITVIDVNDEPTFALLTEIVPVRPLTLQQVIPNYAQSLLPGPTDELGQNMTFTVTNNNPAAFIVQPSIDANGTLSFQFAPGTNNVATVGVVALDNGGTDNGGDDTSVVHLFRIGLYARFAEPTNTVAGSDSSAIAVGDFVKDGVLDIASASYNDGTVTVLRGELRKFVAVTTNAAGPTPIWVRESEFNNDGREDLVVANYTANTVSVLLGGGAGTFAAPVPYAVGASPVHIGLADFNGDGRIDMSVANSGGNTVSILLGAVGGVFTPGTPLTVGNTPTHVFQRDINKDGIMDMAVANSGDNTIGIYFGAGNGTFTFVRNVAVGSNPRAAVLADVNKDNFLDLMVANTGDDNVTSYLGDGTGAFASVGSPFAVGDQPRFIAEVRDVDTDGQNDLIVANYGSSTVSILLGNGDGTFDPAEDYAVGNNPTVVLSRLMFAEDNRTDIVVGNSGSPYVTILRDSAPLAYDKDLGIIEDSNYVIDLSRFAGSGSGPLTYRIVTDPLHGTLVGTLPMVSYVPDANWYGRDSFIFEVTDGILSARAEIVIRTTQVNDPTTYVVSTNVVYTIEDAPTQRFTNFLTSVSGGPPNEAGTVSFKLTSSNSSFFSLAPTISATGLLTYRVATGVVGTNTVTIVASYTGNPYPNPQTETFQIVSAPSKTKALQGIYNGLFYEAEGITHESSGFFTFTLASQGAFSGKTMIQGLSHSFTGVFNNDGQAAVTVPRTNGPNLAFNFQLDVSTRSTDGIVNGVVNAGVWTASLLGDRARYNAVTNPAPQIGSYTMVIPGKAGSRVIPAGDGFADLKVDGAGMARLNGVMADGLTMAQSVQISTAGNWPFYASLYGGKGTAIGWLKFGTSANGNLTGNMGWVKTSGYPGVYYPAGFIHETAIIGSTYTPPATGVPVLNLSSGGLVMADGLLNGPVFGAFGLASDNSFVVTGPVPFKLTLTATTGRLTGSFVHPVTKKSSTAKGIVLQQQNMVRGYFLSTNDSGSILLQ